MAVKTKRSGGTSEFSIYFCLFSPYYLFSYHIVIVHFEYFGVEIYIFFGLRLLNGSRMSCQEKRETCQYKIKNFRIAGLKVKVNGNEFLRLTQE